MYVHSSRFLKQIEFLKSLGVDSNDILDLSGISRDDLLDPDRTFEIDQYIKVLEFALDRTGEDYYGLKMGQDPHAAGTIGMMCASCKNLKEAFIQGCKYFKVQGDFAEIDFVDDKTYPKIQYSLAPSWVLNSPDTARHEIDALFAFLVSILQVNSNNTVKAFRISLVREIPEDPYPYEQALGVLPHFGEPANEIVFRESDLMVPMKAFNPETFELLRTHIETQLRRFSSKTLLSEKVRSILLSSVQYSFPDIDTVASRLNMSSRTLQRMLSSENTSFKALLQDTRFDLAKQFLNQRSITVSEISYMLGYSDLGNFSRSFKKYTGMSPQEYRQQLGKETNKD